MPPQGPASDEEDLGRTEEMRNLLQVAYNYPYGRPDSDFIFNCATSGIDALPDWEHHLEQEQSARLAVLSIGSNASPEQLARKWGKHAGSIPAAACTLHDYDSVYAPVFTSYGSVPATLYPSTGARLHTHVLFLDQGQLDHLHSTEGGYICRELKNIKLEFEGNHRVYTSVLAYVHKLGAFMVDGAPIALSRIPCTARLLRDASQVGVIKLTRSFLGADKTHTLDDFVLNVINNKQTRAKWNKLLARCALRATEILETQ